MARGGRIIQEPDVVKTYPLASKDRPEKLMAVEFVTVRDHKCYYNDAAAARMASSTPVGCGRVLPQRLWLSSEGGGLVEEIPAERLGPVGSTPGQEGDREASLFDRPQYDDPTDEEPVLVNVKGLRLARLRIFGDVWLALGLW